jgi:amino acid transporter
LDPFAVTIMDNSVGTMKEDSKIGYWSVVAIGIGGMVGGGIFAVLGLSVQTARGGTPIAFAVAGCVALISAYSYGKLSIAYPSQGGTVEFLNQAYGQGIVTGGLNILLLLSYIVMLSLYAYAFGSYGAQFFPASIQPVMRHVLISAVVLLFTVLNVSGASIVGEAEELIVGIKVCILLIFIGAGIWSVDSARLEPAAWSAPMDIIAGGMVIFLAYEGFELIANSAGDVINPRKTIPSAYYSSVVFVIILYILVSLVTVGTLPVKEILSARDYALAESAKPFLGQFGFSLIAIAALLSTGSAINATLYGATRISYTIAKEGELPEFLERKVWKRPIEGLFLTSTVTLIVANLFDLSSISMMGSAGFLIIFAAVNGAGVRLRRKCGSNVWISAIGTLSCLGALIALVWQTARSSPSRLLVLAVMLVSAFSAEAIYRSVTGRKLSTRFHKAAFREQQPDREETV